MIYFISDIHLGSRVIADSVQHQQRFISLLRQMERDATAIYLLGDVFDFWMEYFWPNRRHFKQFEPVLQALKEIAAKIPVHFFIGNHDLWTFGWLERETGMIIHRQPEVMVLNGRKCYLAHGDGLGSNDRKFLALRRFFHSSVPQFLFRLLPPALGDWMGYGWAASSRRKELRSPEAYKGEGQEELVQFAKRYIEEMHDDNLLFVFGHRHLELSMMIGPRACVYILGDFFRQFTYGTLAEDGVFSLEQGLTEEELAAMDDSSRQGVSVAFM